MKFCLVVLLAWTVFLLFPGALEAGGNRPQITFRIHVQRDQAVGSDSQIIQVVLSQPEQVITVGRYAEINENQVKSVLPTPDGGMMVTFNGTGTKLLETVTSTNQGRIMVVFLNGRVIYAPLIDLPIRSGRLLLPGPLDPLEVQALQSLLLKQSKAS
jgi:preprotein translocase subunit SecD